MNEPTTSPGEAGLPRKLKDRQVLSRQVQGAVVQVLRCLELLGVAEVDYPRPKARVTWLPRPSGLLELYTDTPCPFSPEVVPVPPGNWVITSFQQEFNKSLPVLARSLMPVRGVLPGLGIDPTPWTQLAGATPTLPARRGRNAGADLLLEEDGYLGLYAGPDADEVIWKKNAKRVERLAGLLPQLYRALDRVERTVGPGAVLERVQVAREGRKSLVALDGERFDVTDVYGADKVFGLLREADGDFVPGKVVGAAIELKQFKPKEFKAKLARTNRRLAALVDPVRSGGTRLVLPLPPH